jgi:PKD repeat protein
MVRSVQHPRRRWTLAAASFVGLALTATAAMTSSADPTGTLIVTAAGDYGATSATSSVLSGVAATKPDVHLALGDLSYADSPSEQAWCDYVVARVGAGFPFELLAGNHESDGLDGHINDFSACLPNQLPGIVGTYGRQWYVDVPRTEPLVRFIMISPALTFPEGTWSYGAGSPRLAWVENAIESARSSGTPWVVVAMHKPCLSLGNYSCDVGTALVDSLLSRKVDLVLTGHEHLYQRTKQLALGSSCPSLHVGAYDEGCVADADDSLVRGRGSVFVTAGTGGISLRPVSTTDSEAGYFRSWSGSNVQPTWGYLDLRISADQLTGRFQPTSGSGFTDSFSIATGTPPVNQPPLASFSSQSAGLAASFDGTSSSDPDGRITSWTWDFGDGSAAGSGSRVTHTYQREGTYPVRLTVVDDAGASSVSTGSVTVTQPVEPPQIVTLTAAADTYVHALNRDRVHGTFFSMMSDGSPELLSYLRFDLPMTPAGKVLTSAVLRVRTTGSASASSADPHAIRVVTGPWAETTTTFANRPSSAPAVIGTLPAGSAQNTTYDVPLDAAIVRAVQGSSWSASLSTSGPDSLELHTREVGTVAWRPQLVLTYTASG